MISGERLQDHWSSGWCAGIVFYYGISALVLFRFNTALLSVVVMFNLPLAISILEAFCL